MPCGYANIRLGNCDGGRSSGRNEHGVRCAILLAKVARSVYVTSIGSWYSVPGGCPDCKVILYPIGSVRAIALLGGELPLV